MTGMCLVLAAAAASVTGPQIDKIQVKDGAVEIIFDAPVKVPDGWRVTNGYALFDADMTRHPATATAAFSAYATNSRRARSAFSSSGTPRTSSSTPRQWQSGTDSLVKTGCATFPRIRPFRKC